ncbi:4'-phosphopantetheine phosphatase-like [Rhagoletis pomonella]|uniref:4'-phosphopantetheine phosphatase-like n=1 Tax=Rhagoletis pomonella TaxID=28610 RepID=UPI00177FDC66|nr:4'-phosphopantetheine phosphatase-like [Rhagoletis pomonella]
MCESKCFTLLKDPGSYTPDTIDLNQDKDAASYWFPCFRNLIEKFATQAAESQRQTDATAIERSEKFRKSYLEKLDEYQRNTEVNATNNTVLGVRELLELNETQLRLFGFADPWQQQKQLENTAALAALKKRLEELDAIDDNAARWTELVRGVLAGNMFDWGAQAVTSILEQDSKFGLHAALDRIEKRPWLIDNLDAWLQRLRGNAHKCALIFVDNSGVDVVLGMLPFVRALLQRGTKVLLCANTEPSLNDVTSRELSDLLDKCCKYCNVLAHAWHDQRLLVYANGQRGPCLDMRTLPVELCEAIQKHETDLLVIEGMGRALHTNLYAKFNCETLKLAVIKNKWLAEHLGGDTFAVICKYEGAS